MSFNCGNGGNCMYGWYCVVGYQSVLKEHFFEHGFEFLIVFLLVFDEAIVDLHGRT